MDENAAYTVGLTDEARRNLEGIFAYVSRNLQEPGTAAALIDELEAVSSRLAICLTAAPSGAKASMPARTTASCW